MKFLKSNLVFLLVLAIGYGGWKLYKMPKFGEGEDVPSFSATMIDGSTFDMKSMKGQYVLLDFWGSWCGPCRVESPDLVKLYRKYKSKKFSDAKGFDIVSVAIETNEKRWKQAIQADNLNWKHHIVQLDRFKGPIAKQYGVNEIPTKYLLDKDGSVIMANPTFEEIHAFLDSKL